MKPRFEFRMLCFELRRAELAVRPRVDEFPIELLARRAHDNVGARRLAFDLGPNIRAMNIDEQIQHDDDGEGNENPGKLAPGVSKRVGGFAAGRAAIADDEIEDQSFGENKPHGDDVEDEPEDSIHIAAVGRDIFRKPVLHFTLLS